MALFESIAVIVIDPLRSPQPARGRVRAVAAVARKARRRIFEICQYTDE